MKHSTVVVIPNWNGADYIIEALGSLQKQTLKHDVIVVDNGSEDDSVSLIEKFFPEVTILKFLNNAGFAGGVNRGIRPAIKNGAEYIALFNNDAKADKDWLKHLVGSAENHPEAGIITGKFMRMDKKHIDSTGDTYSTHGMPFPRGRNQVDTGQYDKSEFVFGATGGASLYRVKMLKDIGLFDEDFFAYFEDVDISFRAQLNGWKVWYEPKAVAYHHVSATSSKLGSFSRFHSIKNFIYTYHKNMPGILFWKYKPLFLLRLTRMGVGALRDKQLLTYFKAIWVTIIHTPTTLARRHKIQHSRKVNIKYIDSILFHGSPPKIPRI